MSIQKVPRKKGMGYRVRWIEIDDRGNRTQPSETYDSLAAAKRRWAEVQLAGSRDSQVLGTKARQELKDWMWQTWWPTWVQHSLDTSTKENYKRSLVNHILPRVGHRTLNELAQDPTILQRWQNDMRKEGVGEPTIDQAVRVLSSSLGRAVKSAIIPINPCSRLEWSSSAPKKYVRAADPAFFEEVRKRLLKADSRAGAPAWLMARDAAYCMTLYQAFLRPQEANALQWQHIDLDAGIILVEQATKPDEVGTTKTGGIRAVEIGPALVEDLRTFKHESENVRRRGGIFSYAEDEHFVFSGRPGGPARTLSSYRSWRRGIWRPAVADVVERHPEWRPFENARPYLARHSGISLMLLQYDYRTVAGWAGHASATLLKYYAHAIRAHRNRELDVQTILTDARRDSSSELVPEVTEIVADIMPGEDTSAA